MPPKRPTRLWLPATLLLLLFSVFILLPASVVFSQSLTVTTFPIGTGTTGQPGVNDSVTRQIVRANNDQLYVFGAQAQGSTHIVTYWTTSTGVPTASTDFNGSTSTTATGVVISVDAVYDGNSTIHVLANDESGKLNDYPFDTDTNTFGTALTVATDSHSISGDYIGTVGVSGMVDLSGHLQVAYWNSSNHIMFRSFTYNGTTLSLVSGPTQIDSAGSANHPSVAVSPADGSLTIAWVSQATSTPQILSRIRTSGGTLESILTVSTAKVWTSTIEGINIDQGPGLLIDSTGTRHLTYIEDYITGGAYGGNYGRVHYATLTENGSSWTDNVVSITGGPYSGAFYSHDPSPAIDNHNQIYIIAHGPPTGSANKTLYVTEKTGTNSWGALQVVNTPPGSPANSSFDASVSVKWSVTGWNRPNVVEFLYFLANGGNYNNTTFYYGHLPPASINPTPTPTLNLLTPPARNYFTIDTPTLTWTRVTGAVSYEVQVSPSAGFTSLSFSATGITGLNVLTTHLDNGTYYWRVRGVNSVGVPGTWSKTETLTVNA